MPRKSIVNFCCNHFTLGTDYRSPFAYFRAAIFLICTRYDLANVAGWEPCSLHDLTRVSYNKKVRMENKISEVRFPHELRKQPKQYGNNELLRSMLKPSWDLINSIIV